MELGAVESVRLRAAAAAAMLAPWRLLFLPMISGDGAGAVRSEGPSVRYVYLNLMRLGWWCCIPFWVLLLPRRWISVSRRRSSSSSSPVRTSPMDFQRLHVRRSWIRRAVYCGISKGWGLFMVATESFLSVFCALFFMPPMRRGRIGSFR